MRSSILWFIPQLVIATGPGHMQACRLELHLSLLGEWKGPQALGSSAAFPGTFVESWVRSGVAGTENMGSYEG